MKIIRDFQAARAVLRRSPFELGEVPPQIKQRIIEVFGQELTPEEAVARIIAEVRERRDAALFEYTRRIDGVALKSLEVSKEEIDKA